MSPTSHELFDIESDVIGAPVPTALLRPTGDATPPAGGLPLFILLHGGAGDRDQLQQFRPWIDDLLAEGDLPPAGFVMFSSGGFSGYLGAWEDFIAAELPEWLEARFATTTASAHTIVAGMSMGGYGALKSAFRTPERFVAVGAMEPAIEPTLTSLPEYTRNTWHRGPAPSLAPRDNPARQALDHAGRIRASGLSIYLEVGDEDYIGLHDGAEFLHRVLWDNDIRHEYHLVRWADHVGASVERRFKEMCRFLAKALNGGRLDGVQDTLSDAEQEMLQQAAANAMSGAPAPPEWNALLAGHRGPTLHARAWKPLRDMALADPAIARGYAQLPPTTLNPPEG